MRLLLVRHPPPAIGPGLCYGRLDMAALPETVPALAARIASENLARIWSSPALRCRMVADAVAGVPVRVDARLLELDFGAWEGVAWDDVPRAALDRWAADPAGFAPPGGESGAALLARVRDVQRDIRAAGEDCAIVAHGGPLKLLAALLRGDLPDLLAPAPAIGSVQLIAVSDAHSAAMAAAPSTSPV